VQRPRNSSEPPSSEDLQHPPGRGTHENENSRKSMREAEPRQAGRQEAESRVANENVKTVQVWQVNAVQKFLQNRKKRRSGII